MTAAVRGQDRARHSPPLARCSWPRKVTVATMLPVIVTQPAGSSAQRGDIARLPTGADTVPLLRRGLRVGAAGTGISGRSPASPVRMGALTGVPRSPHPRVPAPPRPRLSPGCRGAEAQVTRAVPARGAGTQTGDGPCRSLAVGGAVPPPPGSAVTQDRRLRGPGEPETKPPLGREDPERLRPPPHHRTRASPARWRRHRLGRAAGLGRDPRTRPPSAVGVARSKAAVSGGHLGGLCTWVAPTGLPPAASHPGPPPPRLASTPGPAPPPLSSSRGGGGSPPLL